VGQVIRPHGIGGEMRVQAFAAGAPNLQAGRRLLAGGAATEVMAARYDRDAWLLRLSGVDSREAADRFRRHLLEAPDAEVVRQDDESYFIHELVGLRVVTDAGQELGHVTGVLQPGANDVYVVSGPCGDVLVPAIGDVVRLIDLSVGMMVITPIPGLLDEAK
jgi:16S rRNA processing protein RimM